MFKDRLKLFNDITRILTRSDSQFTGMLDWRAHDSKQVLTGTWYCLDFLTRWHANWLMTTLSDTT